MHFDPEAPVVELLVEEVSVVEALVEAIQLLVGSFGEIAVRIGHIERSEQLHRIMRVRGAP